MVGGLFTIGAAASASFRSKNDSMNYGNGGALVGAFAGLRSWNGSLHSIVTKAVAFGVLGIAVGTLATNQPTTATNVQATIQKRYHALLADK